VEIGLQHGPNAVRDLSGAEDTGMHSVLDGGEVAGRTFVIRELAGSAYDRTEPIHLGDSTEVMAVPDWSELPPLPATPAPVPLPARRRVPTPSRGVWLVGIAAAAVLALVLVAWGGNGDLGGNLDPTGASTSTTAGTVDATSNGQRTTATTTPTTVAPTTTEAPPTTTATTLGFPFDDGGALPPGHAKKDEGGKKG
jgi:hypothetical protein